MAPRCFSSSPLRATLPSQLDVPCYCRDGRRGRLAQARGHGRFQTRKCLRAEASFASLRRRQSWIFCSDEPAIAGRFHMALVISASVIYLNANGSPSYAFSTRRHRLQITHFAPAWHPHPPRTRGGAASRGGALEHSQPGVSHTHSDEPCTPRSRAPPLPSARQDAPRTHWERTRCSPFQHSRGGASGATQRPHSSQPQCSAQHADQPKVDDAGT